MKHKYVFRTATLRDLVVSDVFPVVPDSHVLRMVAPSEFPDSQVLKMVGPSVFPDSQVKHSCFETQR